MVACWRRMMATSAENAYQPQLEKKSIATGWPERTRWLPAAPTNRRGLRGWRFNTLLNRYWDDNDTRISPRLDDVKTAKSSESSGNRDLSRPALRRLRLGFQLPLDTGQSAAARHHSPPLDYSVDPVT